LCGKELQRTQKILTQAFQKAAAYMQVYTTNLQCFSIQVSLASPAKSLYNQPSMLFYSSFACLPHKNYYQRYRSVRFKKKKKINDFFIVGKASKTLAVWLTIF
jgi:hypothetical protein